jgi:ATP phosphoribosyltransferase regulatory subunit HisZ
VDGVVGKESLRLVVGHTGVYDSILTDLPVDRSSDAVLVAKLES